MLYSTNPAIYTKGTPIANNTPTNSGGVIISYAVSPALPIGLTLNAASGIVSGTPSAITSVANYTVTATNTGGTTTVALTLTVNDVAPSSLIYSTSPATYTKGIAITPNNPSNAGGTVLSYAVNPSLPSGITLNTVSGVISGTSSVIAATANYTVTATNSGGATSVALTFTVNDQAPIISYPTNPAFYSKGVLISNNIPNSTGGTVLTYGVSPALPAGLSLDSVLGIISGTPTVITALNTYIVSATNSGGTTTVNLSITVNDVPPSSLIYSPNSIIATKGSAITPLTVTSYNGGTVTGYSISPSLPAGLSLSTSTGTVSGTPTVLSPLAAYTVTATNTGGATTAAISITVNDVTPTTLTYSTNPATYTKGTAIAANSPTSSGGPVVSYSVSPALPTGLSLSTTTGIVSGTPTGIATTTNYTVTATNTGGSATVALNITVNDVGPSSLTYSTNPATYTKGTAIPTILPAIPVELSSLIPSLRLYRLD